MLPYPRLLLNLSLHTPHRYYFLSLFHSHIILIMINWVNNQAGLTFLYITFLSILGERMAGDLRLRLFHRLLHLDMSFFDAEKTAELSSRLNVDVQEFKSSFKITISQGLRTLTQVGQILISSFISNVSTRLVLIDVVGCWMHVVVMSNLPSNDSFHNGHYSHGHYNRSIMWTSSQVLFVYIIYHIRFLHSKISFSSSSISVYDSIYSIR